MLAAMLSPTSLAGLSIGPNWVRPIRAVNPATSTPQGSSRQIAPLSPGPLALPNGGGQPDGNPPSRALPRGSLLDLSV
jgi:hypothetical protein